MKVKVKVAYQETVCKEVTFIKEFDDIDNLELQRMLLNKLSHSSDDSDEYDILIECENSGMIEEANKDIFYERNITDFNIEVV